MASHRGCHYGHTICVHHFINKSITYFIIMKKFVVFFLALSLVAVASSCKKDELCFNDAMSGTYVGELVDGVIVSNTGRVSVRKNSCGDLTIQLVSPGSKTFTVNTILTGSSDANSISYTGRTSTNEPVTIDYNNRGGSQTIDITVGSNFTFSGVKQ